MSRGGASQPQTRPTGSSHTILVENEAIQVEPRLIPIGEVHLDPNNPRIQHAAKQRLKKTGGLSPRDLCALILDQPGVSDLFKTIRDNGGLIERIYVRPDGRVIEGNCRVASFLRLADADKSDQRWKAIPAFVVPAISERQVAVLQGHFHVAGKNKWRAYEKAGHLHTMHTTLGMDAKAIGRALGMQERVVSRLLQAYEMMTTKLLPRMKGSGLDKWSHVEEFFKNKELEDYRGNEDNVDDFVKMIVDKKLKHGADVRKLPRILKHSQATKVLKKEGVDKAISVVGRTDPTADSVIFRRLKELAGLLNELPANDLERLRQEKKAQQLLKDLAHAIKTVAEAAGLRLG